MEFDGKVAFVTGGASGIGLATVTALAESGATVYFGDINEDAGRAAARDLEHSGKPTFLRVDVTDGQSVGEAVRRIQDERGQVDILINAAGWSKVERFSETTPELWRRLIDLELRRHAEYDSRAAAAHDLARRRQDRECLERCGTRRQRQRGGLLRCKRSGDRVHQGDRARDCTLFAECELRVPGPTDTPLLASIPEKQREALMRAIPFRASYKRPKSLTRSFSSQQTR
jgi:2-hydroxycyclohexanecarboxyl-CoA dehydrogenase